MDTDEDLNDAITAEVTKILPLPHILGINEAAKNVGDGCLYFLANLRAESVKVGYTNNLKKRVDVLQTGNHDRLEVVGYFSAPRQVEKVIHSIFKESQIVNEWFEYDAKLDSFICVLEDCEAHIKARGLPGTIDGITLGAAIWSWIHVWKTGGNYVGMM